MLPFEAFQNIPNRILQSRHQLGSFYKLYSSKTSLQNVYYTLATFSSLFKSESRRQFEVPTLYYGVQLRRQRCQTQRKHSTFNIQQTFSGVVVPGSGQLRGGVAVVRLPHVTRRVSFHAPRASRLVVEVAAEVVCVRNKQRVCVAFAYFRFCFSSW